MPDPLIWKGRVLALENANQPIVTCQLSQKNAPTSSGTFFKSCLADTAPSIATERILNIVVEVELVRMRAHSYGVGFVFRFVVDPEFDELFGENAAFGEELVILAEFGEGGFTSQRCGA